VTTSSASCREQIEREGFAVLREVFADKQVDQMLRALEEALREPRGAAAGIRSESGTLYAARNILEVWPDVATAWQVPPVTGALSEVLGPDFGLVRVLYFDKPPNQSWALPWHKDMTIAVRDNRLPSRLFAKPTRKAGVPHVEAPCEVLEQMLTARIHLDNVTDENGPLKVIPGSHHAEKALNDATAHPVAILAERGDVLLMRPLLDHASGKSLPDTTRHRRIVHLEFAANRELPDGYAWHHFVSVRSGA
jgi:ectoine hydroxylase-related dioxygenase (phytanoyl-CoA dioxygenase family)